MESQDFEKLMLKGMWSLEDIKQYCDCGTTKASQIRQAALKLGGGCIYSSKLVLRDKVLEALGLDPASEKALFEVYFGNINKESERKEKEKSQEKVSAILKIINEI